MNAPIVPAPLGVFDSQQAAIRELTQAVNKGVPMHSIILLHPEPNVFIPIIVGRFAAMYRMVRTKHAVN